MSESSLWEGDWTEPGIRFRVEVAPSGVLLVWYTPNPHGGVDVGERRTLEEFLGRESDQEAVRTACGNEKLAEVLELVRRLVEAKR